MTIAAAVGAVDVSSSGSAMVGCVQLHQGKVFTNGSDSMKCRTMVVAISFMHCMHEVHACIAGCGH